MNAIRVVMPKDDKGSPTFKNAPDKMMVEMEVTEPQKDMDKKLAFFPGFDENGNLVGMTIKAISKIGYGGDINFMIGVDPDGKILEISILSMQETPGLGTKIKEKSFQDQFVGKSLSTGATLTLKKDDSKIGDIDAVSGATISSRAMTNTVRRALSYYKDHKAEILEKIKNNSSSSPSESGK
jgi:RnfABCDGE-type electron transport complex G subunit